MTGEQHFRQETEQQRLYARRKLRTLAERKVKGRKASLQGTLQVKDIPLCFEDGLYGHISHIKGAIGGEEYDVVKIHIHQTEDPMGPFTQYTSKAPGEFTRSDQSPLDLGALAREDMATLSDDEKGVAIFLGALAASAEQLRNAEEGIDDHPITAQEAWDVLKKIETARVV